MADSQLDSPSETRGRRVLVVDDEAGMREMLGMLLSKNGYAVSLASDGKQAFEAVKKGNIDIVLTDVRMPKLDGLGLLEETARRQAAGARSS